MARNNAQRRRQLFDLYSRHIALYEPDKHDIFFCPLCLRGFPREAIEARPPAVDLAHVIPQSLGGTCCTLTCSECNSRGGTALEAALLDRFAAEDVVGGESLGSGRLSGAFGNIGIEWKVSPERSEWSVYAVHRQTNPANLAALRDYLNANADSGQVRLTLTPRYRHRPGPVRAAFYQSAFLLMFRYFGYPFVSHPHFEPMREQILRPEENIWRADIAPLSDASLPAPVRNSRQSVVFNYDPPLILTILRLRPREGRERVMAVMLPGLDDPKPQTTGLRTLTGGIVPYRPEALLGPKNYLGRVWRHIRRVGTSGG